MSRPTLCSLGARLRGGLRARQQRAQVPRGAQLARVRAAADRLRAPAGIGSGLGDAAPL